MRVFMLGPLRLRDGADREIEVGGTRLRMLLVRLALDAGRIVPSESLIDGLWGEQPPVDATNALQSLVSRLRKAGMAKLVESHPVGYSLAVTDVDVHTFERLAAEGSQLLRSGQVTPAAEILREALDLWRGPALVDVADAPFAGPAVARLAELRLSALEDRIEADISRGRATDVIVELTALAREHPLQERLAGLLIRALHQAGRQADALAAYETARRDLVEELGVDPGQELREAHLAVLQAKSADVPANGSRLPAQLTSFVGRQTELSLVRKMLTMDRLVTLVGPGGAGKTRLATEAASKAVDRVWFVHLAGLREAVDVPIALATTLGLGDVAVPKAHQVWPRHVDVTKRLLDALADRADLVVLDNCEHVISAAAELADTLLAGCPRLRILATSREPLAITGESLLPVGPLDLPDEHSTAHEAVQRAAVRLFVDRAASVRPGFTVDDENVRDVVAVCRQLDGLPLALELAAARLRSMTVGQIAERLDDRFRLLTGGSRTSLPRHQTLGAVVEWSWSLLTDAERTLATRLSVFANAATLDAVIAVAAGDDLPASNVLYVLASLVEKSFVEAREGQDGPPRYRMLQTVRAFSGERLANPDEIHARLCAYFLAFVEEIEPRLRGHEQVKWLKTLDADSDNVIAAVRFAVDQGDAETATRIAASWTWYWMLRQGVFGEAISEQLMPVKRMLEMESQAPADAMAMVRVLALASGGYIDPIPNQIKRLAQACKGHELRRPLLVLIEPMTLAMLGENDEAEAAFRRAIRHPDPWARAAAVLGGAMAVENLGDLERAERWFGNAITRFRDLGDRWGLMMSLNGYANIRSMHGEIEQAIALHNEAKLVEGELGPTASPPMTTSRLADQYYRLGELRHAEEMLESALVHAREQGQQAIPIAIRCRLATVCRARGDLAAARAHITAARSMLGGRAEDSDDPMKEWVDTADIYLLIAEGDLTGARTAAKQAFEHTMRQSVSLGYMNDAQGLADVAEATAAIIEATGDHPLAARLLGASAAISGALDVGSPDVRALLDVFAEPELETLERARRMPAEEAISLLRDSVA